MYILYIVIFIK